MAAQPFLPLPRPRLSTLLATARLALVEAGGGFGKSVLIGQVRDDLGLATLDVVLGPRDQSVAALVGRLRATADRSRLSDLVAATRSTPNEDGLDGLMVALAGRAEPVLLLIDDAQFLDDESARVLATALRGMPVPHHCVVAARVLPVPVSRLRSEPGVVSLDADDLRLDVVECAELLSDRYSLRLSLPTATRVRDATGGWAAAVLLLGSRAARSASPDAVEELLDRGQTWSSLLSDALTRLGPPAVQALGHLARLSAIYPEAAAALGFPDLLARAAAAGIPVSSVRDGTWYLPGPVVDTLVAHVPLEPKSTERLAAHLVDEGEILDALRLLVEAGAHVTAARALAHQSPEQLLRLDFVELQSVVSAIPPQVLDDHAGALLQLARTCEPPGRFELRAEILARAARSASAAADPALLRAIHAEQARDMVRDSRRDEAAALVASVLQGAAPGEVLTRARALDVQGRCLAWHREPGSLRRAGEVMDTAMGLCLRQRQRQWASQVAMPLAIEAQHGIGRSEDALRTLDAATRWLPARSHQRALILTFRAQILNDLGRPDEAEAEVLEALAVAAAIHDPRVVAYAAWEAARTAAFRGRREAALAALAQAEQYAGDWFEQASGATFLAVAAEVAVAVGATESAFLYLQRARARRDESVAPVELATAAVHARIGQPQVALAALEQVAASGRMWPRDAWRWSLFRAMALHRAADPGATAAIHTAFAEAERLGVADLPFVREGDIARPLWAARGATVDAEVPDAGVLRINALGPLSIRRGNLPVVPPVGKPGETLRMLIASGGRISADELADQLWPDDEAADLRTRLRNVLARVRDALGPVVERVEGSLRLSGVDVDAWTFEAEARRVAALPADDTDRARVARTALGRYRGDLLPDDRDALWAVAPRERLRRATRTCLDVLVAEADARADTDEALRLLDRVLEIDAYDEQVYLRMARLMVGQGREVTAREMLRRGRSVLAEMDVPEPVGFRDLERSIGADR